MPSPVLGELKCSGMIEKWDNISLPLAVCLRFGLLLGLWVGLHTLTEDRLISRVMAQGLQVKEKGSVYWMMGHWKG